jgi:hypothetical protein
MSVTTTYSFPSGTDVDFLSDSLQHSKCLSNIQVTNESIIATHTYDQRLDEFNDSAWNEFLVTDDFKIAMAAGLTKTNNISFHN